MPDNNFQIFNENNNQYTTMSDEEYASLDYRLNGLIPMIADPIAHNKMYRQWSIMAKAVANMICDKGYNALDTDVTDLKNNLKTSVKGLARDELQSDITTNANNITTNANNITALQTGKADIGHTHLTADITDITATSTEINTLHGITASTAELNYSTGLTGNIQQQINAITGVMSNPFPTWNASTPYAVGDICIASNFKSYQYLECVVAGTTGATMPTYADVGQLITDNEVKWLVCDFRDSAPVGTFRSDMIQRLGWLKANGATVNRADYPRLWAYAVDNLLTTNDTTNNPGLFGEGDGVDTFELPNFEDYFIRYSYVRGVGTMQASQMASHTHSCGNHSGTHSHTAGNQSANHTHQFSSQAVEIQSGNGAHIAAIGGSGTTITSGMSGDHTHTINSTTIAHKHSIENTGNGSNTYPDNITMQMYIKY